jgi:hypothetical protein
LLAWCLRSFSVFVFHFEACNCLDSFFFCAASPSLDTFFFFFFFLHFFFKIKFYRLKKKKQTNIDSDIQQYEHWHRICWKWELQFMCWEEAGKYRK